MRTLLHIILIAIFSYLSELVFPWWTAAVCAFIILALIPASSGFRAFISGFAGVGLLWLGGAFFFSFQTDFILTSKIASMLQLGNSLVLILVTALLGAFIGGFGALSGQHFSSLFTNRPNRRSRYRSAYK